MRWFKNLSFSKQIIGYYLVLFAVTIAVCAGAYLFVMNDTIGKSENDTLDLALNEATANYNSLIERANEYSVVFGFNEEVQNVLRNGSEDVNTSSIRFITASTFLSSVYAFDNYSHMYYSANEYVRTPVSKDVKEASWYEELMDAPNGYILKKNSGGFLQGQASESNYISLIRVINDIDTIKPIGILIVNFSTSEFKDMNRYAQSDYGTDMLLLDDQNTVVLSMLDNTHSDPEKIISAVSTQTKNIFL